MLLFLNINVFFLFTVAGEQKKIMSEIVQATNLIFVEKKILWSRLAFWLSINVDAIAAKQVADGQCWGATPQWSNVSSYLLHACNIITVTEFNNLLQFEG